MVAALDVTGDKYGRLTAVCREPGSGIRSAWQFSCDCGAVVTLPLDRVRSGVTKSCGCLRKDVTRARSITHGHRINRTTTRTRKAYEHAKGRCFNPNDAKYPQYGGRGISMSDAWAADFTQFLADMGECPEAMTLDRIDVHGHYEPGNCRWATIHQQARNRTDNVFVDHEGRRLVLKDFARVVGVSYKALHARVKYKGQTAHEAAEALLK